MEEMLHVALKISVLIFMVGNLLAMGMELALKSALGALRNLRFLSLSVVWAFVVGPVLAWAIVRIIPMERPYAIGLLLLGMTPCAPFVPIMVRKARGDLGYAAALLIVASVGTVAFLPVAVPLMVEGLTADAWAIAKPLLLFVLAPLLIGAVIKGCAAPVATRSIPPIKGITLLATAIMLLTIAILYGEGMIESIGSFAIASQILFLGAMTVASYSLGFGLKQDQRSVLGIGMGTRNIGAAFAPILGTVDLDPRAMVMIALGVPVTLILSALAARWFARHAPGGPAAAVALPRGEPNGAATRS